jgi:single-stranded-DNA-specific exonuclease
LSRSRWNVLPPPPNLPCFTQAGFSAILSRILYHRGVNDPADVAGFISSDGSLCGDPFLLPGMHQAVTRIYRALLAGEKIAVFGDFDTDGVTATAIMVEGLARLGAEATPYIPHRMTEGYGLKAAALENLRKQGFSLVISVDCGVTAILPVKNALKLGLDVVVTDHHIPLDELPPAAAVIDPKLPGSKYSFDELSGVGVAFKLLQALFRSMGRDSVPDDLLDLVALGTVADMVPILGENRYLVKQGLKILNDNPRLGIRELMALTAGEGSVIESETISWQLAPRLNSAGRLDHASTSYQLLVTDSAGEAKLLASRLHQKNQERQNLTNRAAGVAKEQVVTRGITPVLLAQDTEFPVGICGLVASRLVEEFYRPSIVVRTGEELCTGSCRSIPEFNIITALNEFQNSVGGFTQFGGHAQAAGFTLAKKMLPQFQEFLQILAEKRLAGLDLRPRIDIDAEVKLTELGGDVYPTIQQLAPFGQGNPVPTFLSHNVEVLECRTMGNNGDHLKLRVKQNGVVWNAVGFGLGAECPEVHSYLDMVYNVERDQWNGSRGLRLNVIDIKEPAR